MAVKKKTAKKVLKNPTKAKPSALSNKGVQKKNADGQVKK